MLLGLFSPFSRGTKGMFPLANQMMNTGPVTLPGRPLWREMFCAVTVLLGKLSCHPARRVGVPGSAAVKAGEDRSVPAE